MPGIQFGVDGGAEGFTIRGNAQSVLTMVSIDNVQGTPLTLIPTGEINFGITFMYMCFANTVAGIAGGTGALYKASGAPTTLVVTALAGNTLTFSLAIDGTLSIVRTTGTGVYGVAVLALYN